MTLPNQYDFSQQLASLQSQLNQMNRPSIGQPVHKVLPVASMAEAEAILKEMPPGSSDIVAHKSENIMYLLARDENNVPAPIRPMKYDFLDPQDDPTGYVTKKDFERFMEKIEALVAQKGGAE